MNNRSIECQARIASIGFFDGVHRGHRFLIEQLLKAAERRGMGSLLVTFDRHPRTVVSPDFVPSLLTTLDEKLQLLRETEVDDIVVLPFTPELSQQSAKEFMEQVLHERLDVRALLLGYDHRFGHGGGTWEDYLQWGQETGIEVIRAEEMPGEHVSSSQCRRLLMAGDVVAAAGLLGRCYSMEGRVVHGYHVGHELGFPTANIEFDTEKLLPAHGAYVVWALLPDGTRHAGMLNIGNRPTIDNGNGLSVEVNLLQYDGDLYGQRITVEFVGRLREERRFSSREELSRQLQKDKEMTERMLG